MKILQPERTLALLLLLLGCASQTRSFKIETNDPAFDGLKTWSHRTDNPVFNCSKATFLFNGKQVTACDEAKYKGGSLLGGSPCKW